MLWQAACGSRVYVDSSEAIRNTDEKTWILHDIDSRSAARSFAVTIDALKVDIVK